MSGRASPRRWLLPALLFASVAGHVLLFALLPSGDPVASRVTRTDRPIELEKLQWFDVATTPPASPRPVVIAPPKLRRKSLPPTPEPKPEEVRPSDGPGPRGGQIARGDEGGREAASTSAASTAGRVAAAGEPAAGRAPSTPSVASPSLPARGQDFVVSAAPSDAGFTPAAETRAGREAEHLAMARESVVRPNLMPSAAGLPDLPAASVERPRGRTLRPDDVRDEGAIRAESEGRVKGRIDGWMDDQLAELRVENGIVDGYFSDLRKALEKQTEGTPSFESNVARTMLNSYFDATERYGNSGNPYTVPVPDEPPGSDLNDPLARNRDAKNSKALREKLAQGKLLRDYAEGKMSSGLLALVEIRQGPGGAVNGAYLVTSSGNELFDAHVMKAAPAAVAAQPVPDAGAGIHANGMRSLWEFKGRVEYKKKLSEVKGQNVAYLAAMSAAGLLTGNFDEVTGDIYVVDFTDPKFVTSVRLLRLY